MAWYGTSLLCECIVGDGEPASPLLEERILVLHAEDEASARAAAIAIGSENAHSYRNQFEEQVDWRFVTVIDVKELFDDTIEHGTEVFYRYLTQHEADTLLAAIHPLTDDGSGRRDVGVRPRIATNPT